jgi:hypothetical protein
MKKQYALKNVTFGFSIAHKKWQFILPGKYEFISAAPGGVETANKIANILNGSFERSKGVDGLARANIRNLVNA